MAKKQDKKEIKNKISFYKSFKAELKKVIWPTPKQLINNTVAVLSIVIITALIVFVLDFVFESMNKYGLDNIKRSIIQTDTIEEDSSNTDNLTEENVITNEISSDNVVDNSIETIEENNEIQNSID